MSIDPYDHVICIKCYYRDLLVKMLKFAFLGVYGYTPYHCLVQVHAVWQAASSGGRKAQSSKTCSNTADEGILPVDAFSATHSPVTIACHPEVGTFPSPSVYKQSIMLNKSVPLQVSTPMNWRLVKDKGEKEKVKIDKGGYMVLSITQITLIGQDKLSLWHSYTFCSLLLCHLATTSGAFVKARFSSVIMAMITTVPILYHI